MLPFLLASLAVPAVALAWLLRPAYSAPVGLVFAVLAWSSTLWVWLSGGGVINVTWIPSWGVRFALTLDGLATLYALLATGIGAVILLYAWRYMPLHLSHTGQPGRELGRFHFFIVLFMSSMVGLAMAEDLFLIFVFWDITAIASYFLIGFDAHRGESRASALMALIITGVTAVLLLIGALILYAAHGTFSVSELSGLVESGPLLIAAGAMILVAGLAKSAQAPFHFWLPRAMAAPTPVSAYLHSAAMVAAGVLLIGRVYPIVQQSEFLLDALLVIGLASIFIGGILALTRDVLKQVLAYSTIAQYGFVVVLYGLGGTYGAGGAAFYVITHALAKSALFLTAGTVTELTGHDRLSKLGGLVGRMPLLAVGSGLAAATLTSLPLTLGFFADEFFFAAALERGTLMTILSVLCAGTTLAYTWRLWSGLFLGRERGSEALQEGRVTESASPLLVWPVVGLGALCLVGGVYGLPVERMAEAAGFSSLGSATPLEAVYQTELLPEYLMAASAYGVGVALILSRRIWVDGALLFSHAGEVIGPERAYKGTVHGMNLFSDLVHRLEIRNLRGRVTSVLLPTAVLVGAAVLATPTGVYEIGEFTVEQGPLMLAMLIVAATAVVTTLTRLHVTLAVVFSSSGFALAVAYAFYGGPDVALVAVLIEIMLTLLYFATMRLIPYQALHRQAGLPLRNTGKKAFVSVLAGTFAFIVVWGALSQPSAGETVASEHIRLTPEAHAGSVVSAILADFRGFDTLGEITVVGIVLLGIVTLVGSRVPRAEMGVRASAEAAAASIEGVTRAVAGLLYLPTLVLSVAILVKGFTETGDGFSAGVVATLGIVLRHLALVNREKRSLLSTGTATTIAFLGLLLALGVASIGVVLGDAPLTQYPVAGASVIYVGTIELITAVLFDVGIFLLVFGSLVGMVSAFTYADPEQVTGAWVDRKNKLGEKQ